MMLNLDAVTRNEIASMCYARWSNAWEANKKIKQATWESMNKFCPKADWPDYHKAMMENAAKELAIAEKLKADICPFSPLIRGE